MNTAVIVPTALPAEVEPAEPDLPELALGTCIHGKYAVHGVLGHGGFATVYDALHLGLQRHVAIKVLHVRADTPLALIDRFHREARISALVRHPNVLEVYDTGALPDGSPYLVMERMNGETLAVAFVRATMPIAMVFELGRQLLSALVAIGEAGIVHRDIKPENIMLDHPLEGTPLIKLVDFGISKQLSVESAPRLTWQGALIGTPQYMSPEQMSGEAIDVRTDLYALGAVLYEALTGRAPHECDNFGELLVAVLNTSIVPPRKLRRNCPIALEQLVLKALARNPQDRFPTPRAMLEALEGLAEQLAMPRGSEAFGATDDLVPTLGPLGVLARDSGATARKGWLSRAARTAPSRPTRGYTFAALVLTLLGAPLLRTNTPSRDGPEAATLVPRSGAEPSANTGEHSVRAAQLAVEPAHARAASLTAEPTHVRAAPGEAIVEPLERPSERSELGREVPLGQPLAKNGDVRTSSVAKNAPEARLSRAERVLESKPVSAGAQGDPQRGWEQAMQAALSELVRGSLQNARQRYQDAVRIDPHKPAGLRGLGLVAARLGDVQQAREALRRYLVLAPNARDAAQINARLAAMQ